jgi:hypothetical protein
MTTTLSPEIAVAPEAEAAPARRTSGWTGTLDDYQIREAVRECGYTPKGNKAPMVHRIGSTCDKGKFTQTRGRDWLEANFMDDSVSEQEGQPYAFGYCIMCLIERIASARPEPKVKAAKPAKKSADAVADAAFTATKPVCGTCHTEQAADGGCLCEDGSSDLSQLLHASVEQIEVALAAGEAVAADEVTIDLTEEAAASEVPAPAKPARKRAPRKPAAAK